MSLELLVRNALTLLLLLLHCSSPAAQSTLSSEMRTCEDPVWVKLFEAVMQTVFEFDAKTCVNDGCTGFYRLIGFTAFIERASCPIAQSVARIAHLYLACDRDWHGNLEKRFAQPMALLHLSFEAELNIFSSPENLAEAASRPAWFALFIQLLIELASRLCPERGSGNVLVSEKIESVDYPGYCAKYNWTIGCADDLPHCSDSSTWRRTPEQIMLCRRQTYLDEVQCILDSLPVKRSRLLHLLVPFAGEEWQSVKRLMVSRAPKVCLSSPSYCILPQSRYPPACSGVAPAAEYLGAALCPTFSQESLAPRDGYMEKLQVTSCGQLEVIVISATARRLPGCGVEVESLLQVDTPMAPGKFDSCAGMACREQCASWEGGHFLRFACVLWPGTGREYEVPAATLSGLVTEPTLPISVTCRFPASLLPRWLLAGKDGPSPWHRPEPLRFDLVEVDGTFDHPLQLKLCPYRRVPRWKRNIMACTRPLFEAQGHAQLLADWVKYHQIVGVNRFYIYDADGSAKKLIGDLPASRSSSDMFNESQDQEWAPSHLGSDDILRRVGEAGVAIVVSNFPRRLGQRMEQLYSEFWKLVGGNACVETQAVNHCLSLAKSGGFKWLAFIRGIDKFLHSDFEHFQKGPAFLSEYLNHYVDHLKGGILLHRRDCGLQRFSHAESVHSMTLNLHGHATKGNTKSVGLARPVDTKIGDGSVPWWISCTHYSGDDPEPAWWGVDLGSQFNIAKLTMMQIFAGQEIEALDVYLASAWTPLHVSNRIAAAVETPPLVSVKLSVDSTVRGRFLIIVKNASRLALCNITVEVVLPQPVFEIFEMCVPKQVSGRPGYDDSPVPLMRPGRTLNTFPNFPQQHNASDRTTYAHIQTLRAQHFVKAHEVGGEANTLPSYHYHNPKSKARFTEEDIDMSWALSLMRPFTDTRLHTK